MKNTDYQKLKELGGVVINIDPSKSSKTINPLEIDKTVEIDTQLVKIINFINTLAEENDALTLNEYEIEKMKEILTIAYEREGTLTIPSFIGEMIAVNKNNERLARVIDLLKKYFL
jgi:hypothetical protein